MTDAEILDATCGGKTIWHPDQRDNPFTLFIDRREGPVETEEKYGYKSYYSVEPDEVQDFRDLPYLDESFRLVVFDPPHRKRSDGMDSLDGVMEMKYGALHAETWQADLKDGFDELWRVLKPGGTLVFKFSDCDVDFRDVIKLAPAQPLFGTVTNNRKTAENRWFVFYKPEDA